MSENRRVNKEECITFVKCCLENDMDYKITAKVYGTTYAVVFNYVKKYMEKGENYLG